MKSPPPWGFSRDVLGVDFVLFYYLGCRLLATRGDWGLVGRCLVPSGPRRGPRDRAERAEVSTDVDGRARPGPTTGGPGCIGPFGLLAVLFAIMTSVFASVTLFAADKDLISLTARGVDQPSFEEIAQLYIWQFCKSVPLLDIDELSAGSLRSSTRAREQGRLSCSTRSP